MKKNIILYSRKYRLFKKGMPGILIHFSQFSTLPKMVFKFPEYTNNLLTLSCKKACFSRGRFLKLMK